jgi:outer membrane protein OmpA-like peptidoglycan-associated protein
MNHSTKRDAMLKTTSLLALLFAAACAQALPPQQLLDARAAYAKAAEGPATTLNPAQLHVAKETLDLAEKTFADQGDTETTRDRAYLASRRAELAAAVARTTQIEQGTATSQTAAQAAAADDATRTRAELGKTRDQLAGNQAALVGEKSRREDAERRAAQAAADLARIGSVKQETRGMVITLSGSVLFASNKFELLPAAQAKLSEVAEALLKGDPDTRFLVEGHTDSQGIASANQTLSQNRAESVRTYLVAHNIAADRITAQGIGSTRPIAENNSAEGRANNRRVEIIVQPAATK